MTKYVEAIHTRDYLTEGKIYEVCGEFKSFTHGICYLLKNDEGDEYHYPEEWFKEAETPKEETKFKFIPETEITYATVNGVKGILIKE